MNTNVYGPRPRDCGFRCKDCGSQEYPLFGVALACPRRQPKERQITYKTRLKEWEPESNTHKVCFSCLTLCHLEGLTPYPTQEAASIISALQKQNLTHAIRIERGTQNRTNKT